MSEQARGASSRQPRCGAGILHMEGPGRGVYELLKGVGEERRQGGEQWPSVCRVLHAVTMRWVCICVRCGLSAMNLRHWDVTVWVGGDSAGGSH